MSDLLLANDVCVENLFIHALHTAIKQVVIICCYSELHVCMCLDMFLQICVWQFRMRHCIRLPYVRGLRTYVSVGGHRLRS